MDRLVKRTTRGTWELVLYLGSTWSSPQLFVLHLVIYPRVLVLALASHAKITMIILHSGPAAV